MTAKLPFEEDGQQWGKGPSGERVCRGAMSGRGSDSAHAPSSHKVKLRKVPLDAGGYDPGGAYWGHGWPVWCAFVTFPRWEAYCRAETRDKAKADFQSAGTVSRFSWAR